MDGLYTWAATQSREAALKALHEANVAGEINTAADIATDEPGRPASCRDWPSSPGKVNWAGPDLGEHNRTAHRGTGHGRAHISHLRGEGVIA